MSAPTVLLTGATGFVGGATLARLREARPDCRVVLLARGDSAAAAVGRVRNSVARFVGPDRAGPLLRNCEVVCGDLTDPAALANPLLDAATHVVHLASNTSFRSVRGVRHTNIVGALALAHRMRRAPRLERFLYVGTAYICGEQSEAVVREDSFPDPKAKHFTEYTSSKAECEMLLDATAPELPLVVARPSVVVGHTRLGCRPSASIFWFYRTCHLLRRLTCPLDTRDDVVPVDWTADALLFLLFKPGLSHRRYHVSAGEGSCGTWHELAAAFAACDPAAGDEPYRVVDFETIERERERLRERLGPGDEAFLLGVVRLYYHFMEIDAEVFDNTRLLAEGMPPPPRFTDYLHLCLTQPPDRGVYDQMKDDM
jgi:nucleoside-diphosphate-sugar epimerase